MPIFDRYILRQIFPPLAFTLLIALLVLLVERMLRVLDSVLGSQGTMQVVFELLAYLVPHYLGLALPMALFLGIYFAFRRLSRESEMDAILASGTGLHQLMRPVMLAAVLLSLFAVLIFNTLQPHSRYAYRSVLSSVQNMSIEALIQPGVFVSNDNTTLMVEEISPDRRQFRRIFIHEEDKEVDEAATITAREGILTDSEDDSPPLVQLFNGVRLTTPIEPGAAEGPREPESGSERSDGLLRFEEMQTVLGEDAYDAVQPRGEDEREYTIPELWALKDNPPEGLEQPRLLAEMNERLVRIASILVLPFMAVPLALSNRRSQRSSGVAVGVITLLAFNEALQQGVRMVRREQVEPLLGAWGPLLIFLLGSLLLFLDVAFRVPRYQGVGILDRTTTLVGNLIERRRKRREAS
ncbi:LPS export ABC transporter permease LptF [Fodinicurvata sediminis]|uniref:LPS export ABC transporter permease LptF n=1 Tax=Fodinicurvata sediminis TaxID=1121832 RepID=UPI0003B6B720|nr:LPS export ABC transporter permease LptF [Fodinicurvata sediminis]